MCTSTLVEVSSIKLALNVLVDDGRTGLTALLAIRDNSTAGQRWLDFSDLTFKIAGWVTRQVALTEIGPEAPGMYHHAPGLNVAAVTNLPSVGSELIAEYSVVGVAPAFTGYAIDTFQLVSSIYDRPNTSDIVDGVWDENLASHNVAGSASTELKGKAEPGDSMTISAGSLTAIGPAILDEVLSGHFLPDSLGEAITLIRGLVQQNYMVDSTIFNPSGLLTSSRFRIFSDGAQVTAATDGGAGEGEIATFSVQAVAEPTNQGLMKFYKVSRD